MAVQLLTPEQVADRLQLKLHTVYVWLREGRIPGIRLGHRWRVEPDVLERFIGERRRQATLPAPERVTEGPAAVSKPIWQRFLDAAASIPEDVAARLPEDGAEQHDHYIYGTPKRRKAGA